MTAAAVIGLVAFCVVAPVDWWAVAVGRRRLELIAKPAAMSALVLVAASLGDVGGSARSWLVIGAAFGLLGDVALLGRGETAFMAGLASFAVGHLAYSGAALVVGVDVPTAALAIPFLVVLLGWRFATRTVPGAARQGGLVLAGAVVFYAVVISLMVVTATGTAVWVAAVGAALFAVSDWVLGHARFVGPLPHDRLLVIVPYHVGQALLIVGLATSG